MKIVISFLIGMGFSFLLLYSIQEEVIHDHIVIDSLNTAHVQYKDSIKQVLDSLSQENKIKDTIIILEKYEAAKDGVSFVCNDSLNKIIFKGTGHL